MCDCKCIMKLVLVLVNLAVALAGSALLILGALIIWGKSFVTTFVEPMLTSAATITGDSNTGKASEIVNYVFNLLRNVGIPIFVLGIIIVIIAVCGMLGACCSFSILLIVYACATGLIAAAQIVCLIVIYAKKDAFLKDQLGNTLKKFDSENNATNVETVIWVLLQGKLECCGVDNGTDFDSVSWTRNVTYNKQNYTLQYPYSCCMLDDSFNVKDNTCLTSPNSTNSNIQTGCYTKVTSFVTQYTNIGLIIMICVIVVQVALVLFAIYLIKHD